jgi:mannose-1-phosphate guanylyltransferase
VAAQHRPWWDNLVDRQGGNLVVQPENRGTAAGVLLPLLRVHERDPEATVSILPSDHYVDDEDILRRALERAFTLAERSRHVVLLGMAPDGPDPEYGWILPGGAALSGAKRVARFVEKPGPALARSLYRRRATWSSLMLVARTRTLMSMFERWAPRTLSLALRAVRRGWGQRELRSLYPNLEHLDFSRDLLQRAARQLRLLEVPPCGWTDLGTPARLARWMAPRLPRGALETLHAHGGRSR